MKNKFTPITKIKKQAVNKVENDLAMAKSHLSVLISEIERIHHELINQSVPQGGNMSLMNIYRNNLAILRDEKKMTEYRRDNHQKLIEKMQKKLQNVTLDYEKIKTLEDEESKKIKNAKKRKEQLEMDEIATMLFEPQNK